MKPIPVAADRQIAEKYDYDQVIVIARKVGEGEHCTTYGVNVERCNVAARCGEVCYPPAPLGRDFYSEGWEAYPDVLEVPQDVLDAPDVELDADEASAPAATIWMDGRKAARDCFEAVGQPAESEKTF